MTKKISEFGHIAIIQTAFLGDAALSLYLAQMIRYSNPSAEITFVTTPAAAPLAACSSAINNVLTYDKRGLQSGLRGIKYVANLLSEKNTDCIISPHRSLRTTLLSYLAKPKFSVSFDKSALSFIYSKRVHYQFHFHEIQRNLSLLSVFSDCNINEFAHVELDFNDDDISYVDSKLYALGLRDKENIVLVSPGSIWETKKWHEDYFAKLCRLLKDDGRNVILIGSKEDRVLCSGIAMNSGAVNLAGETSIPQLLILMKNAGLTITNDSAPTHFAGLVNCPVITIFGPTSPKFGFGPTGEKSKIIEFHDLKCKPCTIHGSKKCPVGTHDCMMKINPEEVFSVYKNVIEN